MGTPGVVGTYIVGTGKGRYSLRTLFLLMFGVVNTIGFLLVTAWIFYLRHVAAANTVKLPALTYLEIPLIILGAVAAGWSWYLAIKSLPA